MFWWIGLDWIGVVRVYGDVMMVGNPALLGGYSRVMPEVAYCLLPGGLKGFVSLLEVGNELCSWWSRNDGCM